MKASFGFMDRNPSMSFTILSRLMAMCTLIVEVLVFDCHLILQDDLINTLHYHLIRNSARKVNILPSLVAINTVLMEI